MIKTVDAAREIFESEYLKRNALKFVSGEYIDVAVQNEWRVFLLGFEAAWSSNKPSQYQEHNGNNVWDLDLSAWESIKEAAAVSNWIPEEYFMNDWCSDVRSFLIGDTDD